MEKWLELHSIGVQSNDVYGTVTMPTEEGVVCCCCLDIIVVGVKIPD